MAVNVKRGFNRLFLVLAVMWFCYWAVVFPWQQNQDRIQFAGQFAPQHEISLERSCNRLPAGPTFDACEEGAMADAYSYLKDYTIVDMYRLCWPFLLIMGLVIPPIVYGLIRGLTWSLTGIGLWIWRGYKEG